MVFEHQISITGDTGVGTSSLFKALKELLEDEPYRWVSGGILMRQRASEHGMSMPDFAKHCRLHPEEGHDRWCDEQIAKLAETDWMICEGRLAHFFMPHAFHVSLICGMDKRVARRSVDEGRSPSQVRREIKQRDYNDVTRYRNLYGHECLWHPFKFSLVLSSERDSPSQLATQLLREHQKWLAGWRRVGVRSA